MRILLAEDDQLLGDGVVTALRRAGYTVDWVTDGAAASHALAVERFDAVVLDWGLPRRDGVSVLREMREQRQDLTPVLMLTARDEIDDRIAGLDAGADDYLGKPFSLQELLARLRALTRRATGRARNLITHLDIVLDPAERSVQRAGQPVTLTRREFAMLEGLLAARGTVLQREQLEQTMYGFDDEVGSNTVEVHIHHLRKKLGSDLIRTVRGIGYTIDRESPTS